MPADAWAELALMATEEELGGEWAADTAIERCERYGRLICEAGWAAAVQNSSVHTLFDQVRAHPDFVFGTIFVTADFPSETAAADARLSHVLTDRLVEVGNEAIADLYGDPESYDDPG